MATHYPRTNNVKIRSLAWYREAQGQANSLAELTDIFYTRIANAVIAALDDVRQQPLYPNQAPSPPKPSTNGPSNSPPAALPNCAGLIC